MQSVIYNDDCFNKFASIPDKSVQLVCVDLPYNCTALKWDCAIDLNKMWIELKRIGRENCKYLFFCNTKFGNMLINSNPKWFKEDIVWKKGNRSVGFLDCNKRLLKNHEMIYLFYNDKKPKNMNWIYNPQKTEGKRKKYVLKKSKIPIDAKCKIYNDYEIKTDVDDKGERFPISIINFECDRKKTHPTAKPVALCEWLIKTYSNEGDVVMDFTMGSGSTIIACINTNRKYIGIEKDETIFLTAQKRIEERNDLIN